MSAQVTEPRFVNGVTDTADNSERARPELTGSASLVVDNRSNTPPVFLVSTGRTGTRFFARLFREYGKGLMVHHCSAGTRRFNIIGSMRYLGLTPKGLARAVWRRSKLREIEQEKRRYVECNGYYFNMLDVIWESLPNASVLFLVRHPRTFIQSYIRWEKQRIQSRIANQFVPFWGPVGYHEQLLGIFGNLHQRTRYFARLWTRRNSAILRAIDGHSRIWTCRFEDIFEDQDGPQRLTELFHWLVIDLKRPIDAETLSAKINRTREANLHWDSRCDRIIHEECGKLMERFGYEI